MMKCVAAVFVLACVVAVSAVPLTEFQYQHLFTAWVNQWGRTYESPAIFLSKYNTFRDNLDFIMNHNSLNRSFTLAMNQFGDLNSDEFSAMHCNGFKPSQRPVGTPAPTCNMPLADSVDWTARGAVIPVDNQGQCGSSWAYAAVGAIEGSYEIFTGKLIPGSVQQLVDCGQSEGNQGCNGGLMDNSYTWVLKNGGLASRADYPYTARDGTCKTVPSTLKISSYVDVAKGDEAGLLAALNIAPVGGAVEADSSVFQFYHDGVLDDSECGHVADHGVLITGYGTTDAGVNYWMVRNQWGTGWGKAGYIWLVRGKNMCAVADYGSYTVTTKA